MHPNKMGYFFSVTCHFHYFLGYKLFLLVSTFGRSLTLGAILCHPLAGIRGALEQRTSRKYSPTLSDTKPASKSSSVKIHTPLSAGDVTFCGFRSWSQDCFFHFWFLEVIDPVVGLVCFM